LNNFFLLLTHLFICQQNLNIKLHVHSYPILVIFMQKRQSIISVAEAVFSARKKDLEVLQGIEIIRANSIKNFNDFQKAEEEIAFIKKYKNSNPSFHR
jgi:hypothetical protein